MSSTDPLACFSGNSMFDWPLASHTSPTNTLVSVMELPPVIIRVSGPPSLRPPNLTIHFPSFTRVDAVCFWNRTVTVAPSGPQPQIGTEIPCCKTMLSEKRRGRVIASPLKDGVGAFSPLAAGCPQRTATAANTANFQDVKCMIYYALKQSAIVKSASASGHTSHGWPMECWI